MKTEAPEPKREPTINDAVCPYCGDDPVKINVRTVMSPVDGLLVLLANCANLQCRKLFTASFQGQVSVKQEARSLITFPRV